MPGIKRRGGKAFCGLYGDDMIFKLQGEDHARPRGLNGCTPLEPMAGRPMKAWVQVPPEHESQYPDLGRAAETSMRLEGDSSLLLPLDGAGRFAGDVEHDTIDLIHLVGDSGTDLFQDLVREPAPIGGHRILAGHRA